MMKRYYKKVLGGFLAVVLTITSLSFSNWGMKEAKAADDAFETIAHTTGNESVTVESAGGNFGSVSGFTTGFSFWVTNPVANASGGGQAKFGFWGTTESNVWSGGYNLILTPGAQGTIGLAVRTGAGERLLAIPNSITGYTDEKILISTWLTDVDTSAGTHTAHISVNGEEIFSYGYTGGSYTNDAGSVTYDKLNIGLYMAVYNEWGQSMTASSVYEDLWDTLGTASYTNESGYVKLGRVSNTSSVVKLKIACPDVGSGQMKVGFFNTSESDSNANGYYLALDRRTTENTVGYAVREGAVESNLKTFGDIQVTDGYLTVIVWMDEGNIHISLNGTKLGNWGPAGSMTLGNYITAYNGWGHEARFYSMEERVYEELDSTAGVTSIEAGSAHTNLGNLSNVEHGFRFRMTNPGTANNMRAKIGLYNATQGNVWSEGYILLVVGGAADGTSNFYLLANTSEGGEKGTLASYAMSGLTGDWLTIAVYASKNAVTVYANGQCIISYVSDGTYNITPGKYMGVYNESATMVIRTLAIEPEEIEYEQLDTTLGKQKISVSTPAEASLGSVSDITKGFSFMISNPGTSNANKGLKLGFYNPQENNMWSGGYIFGISGRSTVGTVDFSLRSGKGEVLISYPGEKTGFTNDYIEISVWLTDYNESDGSHVLHITADGLEIITYTRTADNEIIQTNSDGTTTSLGAIAVGTYFSVYNEWNETVELKILGEADEPIFYEDVKDTIGKDFIIVPNRESANLGQVTQQLNPFMFKLKTGDAANNGNSLKIGLYNTTEGKDVWADHGYILFVKQEIPGTYQFRLGDDTEATLVDVTTLSNLNYEYITVSTWMTDVKKTTGAHTLHIAINGVETINYVNDGSLATGKNMAIYSEWTGDTEILAVFEDIGETVAKNSVTVAHNDYYDFADISHMEKGFRFKVSCPETDPGDGVARELKIGLFNTASKSPWDGGYIISLQRKAAENTVGWSVRTRGWNDGQQAYTADGGLLGFNDLTLNDEFITVYAWLTNVNNVTGTHVVHIALNGVEVVTWTNDGTASWTDGIISCGAYMTVYNAWEQDATIYTLHTPNINFKIAEINNSESRTGFDSAANAWKIYLNTDVSIPGASGTSKEYDWTVSIDGTNYATKLVRGNNQAGNLVYFTIDFGTIAQNPSKNYQIVMPTMTSETTDANGDAYSITLTEAYTLYVRSDKRVLDTNLAYVEDTNYRGDANGDGIAGAADMIRVMRYLDGQELLVGAQADVTDTVGEDVSKEDVNAIRRLLTLTDEEKANGANTAQDVDDYIASGMPSYDENEEMRIGAFKGPRAANQNDYSITWGVYQKKLWGFITTGYYADIASVTSTVMGNNFVNDYEFKQFAEAGFNAVIAEGDAGYSATASKSDIKNYLDLAGKYDIDVILTASKVANYLRQNSSNEGEAATMQEVSDMINEFGGYKAFAGIQMADEIDSVKTDYDGDGTADNDPDAVLAAYKELSGFIKYDLGRDDLLLHTSEPGWTGDESDEMSELINDVAPVNGIFESSCYPFELAQIDLNNSSALSGIENDTEAVLEKSFTHYFNEEEWFESLAQVASETKALGIKETGKIIQSCGYIHAADNKEPCRRDLTSQADVGFQVYTSLAYGIKNLTYFTYWEHNQQNTSEYFTSSIVSYPTDGSTISVKKDDGLYGWVKTINNEVKGFDHVLLDFTWKGTMPLGSISGETSTYTNHRIASATASANAVIGCMKDSEGFDGYMIANATNPENQTATTVSVTFNKASKAIVYVNGVRSVVNLTGGIYQCIIPAGQGIFVIPLV